MITATCFVLRAYPVMDGRRAVSLHDTEPAGVSGGGEELVVGQACQACFDAAQLTDYQACACRAHQGE